MVVLKRSLRVFHAPFQECFTDRGSATQVSADDRCVWGLGVCACESHGAGACIGDEGLVVEFFDVDAALHVVKLPYVQFQFAELFI